MRQKKVLCLETFPQAVAFALADSVIGLIGNTPMVRINKLNHRKGVRIFVKLEGQNPSGSTKDRIALRMIEGAEKTGALTKEKTILEATSGNTGIALSMIAAVKGYRALMVMPGYMSKERRKIMAAYGAKVMLSSAAEGYDGALRKARKIMDAEPEKYWMPNQFDNPLNPIAHYESTAAEILRAVPGIAMVVAGIGTSGTLVGVAKHLKEFNPKIRAVAVEPEKINRIDGLKNLSQAASAPKVYDPKVVDETTVVSDIEAFNTARILAKTEGLFLGISSGAAVAVALKKAREMKSGDIVVISADRGEKYLSTDLFK